MPETRPPSTELSKETRKALDMHRQRVAESLRQLELHLPDWVARIKRL